MLFNVARLKRNIAFEQVEMAIGEMCNVVKESYGDDHGGFIAGQAFRYNGFVSEEGSLGPREKAEEHVAIVTYWKSFEQHEMSHADAIFKEKFGALSEYCSETYEIGYKMLWQGAAGYQPSKS